MHSTELCDYCKHGTIGEVCKLSIKRKDSAECLYYADKYPVIGKNVDCYFVYNKKELKVPFACNDESSAIQEAEDLASKFPGQIFTVLKVIGYAKLEGPNFKRI